MSYPMLVKQLKQPTHSANVCFSPIIPATRDPQLSGITAISHCYKYLTIITLQIYP